MTYVCNEDLTTSINFLTWFETEKRIEELNRALNEGERPWRLPTAEELRSAMKTNPGIFADGNGSLFENNSGSYWAQDYQTVRRLAGPGSAISVGPAGSEERNRVKLVR